ncbi:MAG: SDR family oxidoreductase [Gemmatimonadetes bacterium]|jgi:uncharacterized protein YbjT (DUF2867 family)|nr:SDR family oxidoreductase [Gemmatimonadota bacterium]
MQTRERVLVIGATGGTGRLIAQRLVDERSEVRVLARSSARARGLFDGRVEVVKGDVTQPETLAAAVAEVDHIIYTAGVTKRPAREAIVKATEFDGVLNTIAAARATGFTGRFLLMGAIGTTRGSILSFLLNLIKGNTLRWRRRAEEALRKSGLEYTIIHAGILTDAPGGQRAVEIGQAHYPMRLRYRISRADAAELFVRALRHPNTRNTTFDAVWARNGHVREWGELFRDLRPDGEASREPARAS